MAEDKEIMYESDESAAYRTGLEGWVSAKGHFFGKGERAEHGARYDGSTHHIASCGHKTRIGWSKCDECMSKESRDKYEKMPSVEWNGSTPLCLFDDDKYFFDEDDIFQYCEDNDIESVNLRLCICEPNHYTKVTSESIAPEDVSPEDYDGYLPEEIQEALDALNKVIGEYKNPFTWSQGKQRVTVIIDKREQ
jgi:hypothetical protein